MSDSTAPDPISAIRNLGPASEAAFARAGIHTATDVRGLGADEAYRRLILAGTQPHFIGYYALVMGLQGRPWNDCKGPEKIALRTRFDTIRVSTASQPLSDLEKALNILGVIARNR